MTTVKPDGTSLTSDADLRTTDQVFFGSFRAGGSLGKVIPITGEYGGSPIGNEAWDVDANTAINQYLATLPTPINPANVPTFTVISVVWQPSGITAKFIRTNSVPSLLWAYVPGSMKDASGNPLTPVSGALMSNPNAGAGGAGSGTVLPTSPWTLTLSGGNTCSGSATATIDGIDYIFKFFVPC
jgi:hypothetical protein